MHSMPDPDMRLNLGPPGVLCDGFGALILSAGAFPRAAVIGFPQGFPELIEFRRCALVMRLLIAGEDLRTLRAGRRSTGGGFLRD